MPELTAALRKRVYSLGSNKGRRKENAFVVEGSKSVLDTLDKFDLIGLFATHDWLERCVCNVPEDKIYRVTRTDLERMSSLSTPSEVMAVYVIPDDEDLLLRSDELYIALDGIQDPGNLGTIVRLADWFGVTDIISSHDTVDIYNPKAVMATMGSIGRVRVHYVDLSAILGVIQGIDIYGTFLDGDNIYSAEIKPAGILIMGNEGKGISPSVERFVSKRLSIPAYPVGRVGAESLNVAMATGITLAEFRRRSY